MLDGQLHLRSERRSRHPHWWRLPLVAAFLAFVRERGLEHEMLEATISVNRRLEASVPAAPSADKVDTVREAARQPAPASIENLAIELGGAPAIVL